MTMKLSDIIKGLQPTMPLALDPEVSDICFDSRKVGKGSCFVAKVGTKVDGHAFIDATIQAGAVAVVCQQLPKSGSLSPEHSRWSVSVYLLYSFF